MKNTYRTFHLATFVLSAGLSSLASAQTSTMTTVSGTKFIEYIKSESPDKVADLSLGKKTPGCEAARSTGSSVIFSLKYKVNGVETVANFGRRVNYQYQTIQKATTSINNFMKFFNLAKNNILLTDANAATAATYAWPVATSLPVYQPAGWSTAQISAAHLALGTFVQNLYKLPTPGCLSGSYDRFTVGASSLNAANYTFYQGATPGTVECTGKEFARPVRGPNCTTVQVPTPLTKKFCMRIYRILTQGGISRGLTTKVVPTAVQLLPHTQILPTLQLNAVLTANPHLAPSIMSAQADDADEYIDKDKFSVLANFAEANVDIAAKWDSLSAVDQANVASYVATHRAIKDSAEFVKFSASAATILDNPVLQTKVESFALANNIQLASIPKVATLESIFTNIAQPLLAINHPLIGSSIDFRPRCFIRLPTFAIMAQAQAMPAVERQAFVNSGTDTP